MAEMSDDKSASWREKYLDALDQQEKLEKDFALQQESLRRALVRVSVSADGQDEALDNILGQLRERMRGAISGDISGLLTQLDQVALGFEQSRDQNAQAVRQSLMDTVKPLQQLDLSRSVKKDISEYLSQLPQRSKKVRLYPALLQQLATIQQQALKEIEQPKTGFLQKILGNNGAKSDEKAEAESSSVESTVHQLADQHPSSAEPRKNPAPEKNTQAVADVGPTATRILGRNGSPSNISVNTNILPPEFIDKVTLVINQFLNGLEGEEPLVKKIHAVRERISAGMNAEVFIVTLETLRDLVMQAYLTSNQAFASYLKNVNQELAEIYTAIGGSAASESSRQAASNNMQASMRQEMAALESSAETATDLAQLKNQVKSQIGNIRQALDQYQQAEQAQQQLSQQLEALAAKIKNMEDDAEKNREVLEKQRHKALHDPLTELPNREYYNERAAYEFQRWQRYARPLTLAIFDIDHFKKINDNYGHQAGDRVLKVIGRSIAKRLREVDFFCRFGGEEFVVLMPETQLDEAAPVLDKIRSAIANASFNYKDQPLIVTLSIGVTEFKTGDDLDTAFARADEALYAAKAGGRNCLQSA